MGNNINFAAEVKRGYINKMKNKLFSLLNEYEKKREWKSFLDAILIELSGFNEADKTINYLTLYYKLSAARYLNHEYFRKTIFDCMSLLEKMEVHSE